MEYIELQCTIPQVSEMKREIICALLTDYQCESFADTDQGVNAYIQAPKFNSATFRENEIKEQIDFEVSFSFELIPDKNWNEEWEKNYFSPIIIGDKCLIKGPFHTIDTKAEYTIVIEPKMSFGTGHHATTSQMIEHLLRTDVSGKRVLDMGCGTSVLAILSAMRGAQSILAIDNDEWAYNNSIENAMKNNAPNIKIELGDASNIAGKAFDVVLANINRNILLADIQHYAKTLPAGGILLMSGFYTEDVAMIEDEAIKNGLTLIEQTEKINWAVTRFVKQ